MTHRDLVQNVNVGLLPSTGCIRGGPLHEPPQFLKGPCYYTYPPRTGASEAQMGLRDLPVVPTLGGDVVRNAYISELLLVTTPEALQAFVTRWKGLYNLRRPWAGDSNGMTEECRRNVAEGRISAQQALDCIVKSREGACEHAPQFSCEGAHIVLPDIFLAAEMVSSQYDVGTDLALIQTNGGLEALEGSILASP